MKWPVTVVAAGLLGLSGTALAQDPDDWDYGEDPSKGLSAAMVEYDGGRTIVVECSAGDLSVAIVGLPAHPSEGLRMDARRADGRSSRTVWTSRPGEVRIADTPGRTARLLRGGGPLELASRPGETPALRAQFERPSANAQVDRVLTACGRAIADDRDTLPDGSEYVADLMWARPIGERLSARSPDRGGDRRAEISCVIDAGRLRACQLEQELPSPSGYGRAAVAAAEGRVVNLTDAGAAQGTVLHLVLTSTRRTR
jgi:hypothetical protein